MLEQLLNMLINIFNLPQTVALYNFFPNLFHNALELFYKMFDFSGGQYGIFFHNHIIIGTIVYIASGLIFLIVTVILMLLPIVVPLYMIIKFYDFSSNEAKNKHAKLHKVLLSFFTNVLVFENIYGIIDGIYSILSIIVIMVLIILLYINNSNNNFSLIKNTTFTIIDLVIGAYYTCLPMITLQIIAFVIILRFIYGILACVTEHNNNNNNNRNTIQGLHQTKIGLIWDEYQDDLGQRYEVNSFTNKFTDNHGNEYKIEKDIFPYNQYHATKINQNDD